MVEEKTITQEYLREVDENLEMIPLTFDVVFKGVFGRNLDILKRFLISTLKLELDSNSTKIELLNNELFKENITEYQKRVDILVVLNDKIYIDIEINRNNFESVKPRNSLYCDKLYSTLLEMGEKTSELKEIYLYQLSLNANDYSITYGEDVIVSYSLVTKEIFVKNKFIVLKYLEFYRDLYYTNVESLSFDEIWLASLASRNFTELNKMLSCIMSVKDKDRIVSEAIRMSRLEFNLHEWEKAKMDELVLEETKRIGREEGREEEKEEIIRIMLKKNMSLQDIADITNKTMDEIKEIQSTLE